MLADACGDEGDGVVAGSGLLSAATEALGNGLTVALTAAVAAGVGDVGAVGAAVALVEALTPVVVVPVVLVVPVDMLTSALKRGTVTP